MCDNRSEQFLENAAKVSSLQRKPDSLRKMAKTKWERRITIGARALSVYEIYCYVRIIIIINDTFECACERGRRLWNMDPKLREYGTAREEGRSAYACAYRINCPQVYLSLLVFVCAYSSVITRINILRRGIRLKKKKKNHLDRRKNSIINSKWNPYAGY